MSVYQNQANINVCIRQGNSCYNKIQKDLPYFENELSFIKQHFVPKKTFVPCGGCMVSKAQVSPSFKRAFLALNRWEQAQLYRDYTAAVFDIRNNVEDYNSCIQLFRQATEVFVLNTQTWEWQLRQIELTPSKKLRIVSLGKEINLRHYLLRVSKNKKRSGIALQSTDSEQSLQTLRISHPDLTFEQLYIKFKAIMHQCLCQNVRKRLGLQQKARIYSFGNGAASEVQSKERENNKNRMECQIFTPTFKNSTFLSEFGSNPRLILSPPVDDNQKFAFAKLRLQTLQYFTELRKDVYYNYHQSRLRKCYFMKIQDSPLDWIIDNLRSPNTFSRWKKTLLSAKLLKSQTNRNSKQYYESHQFSNGLVKSYIYTRTKHCFSNVLYFFDQSSAGSYKGTHAGTSIDYCIWKVQQIDNKRAITVETRINHGADTDGIVNRDLTDQFIGELSNVLQGCICPFQDEDLNVNTRLFEEQYVSQINDFQDVSQLSQFYTIEQHSNRSKAQFAEKRQTRSTNHRSSEHEKLLHKRHIQGPMVKAKPDLIMPTRKGSHPLWQGEWKINEKGEMLSINIQKVKAQNGILKSVIQTIGRNLFNGKSILNISLPVTIFSKESNLSLICKAYAYAPLLLQKAVRQTNPVDRLKYVVAFSISRTIAQIQMEKPFNPILGETFQAMIDGCPVYGQQISHHPPISAVFMKGRGYNLHGQSESIVHMGLNSATGSNSGVMTIDFEDGRSLVKFCSFSGEISGLVYGNRKLCLVGINHFLDLKNRLFVEVKIGKHKGITEYCKFVDGVQGTIVKLKQSVDLSEFWKITKKQYLEQYGIISGRWTQELYYEDQPIFNSWQDLPHVANRYEAALESDSFFRADLLSRIALDFDSAQQSKEALEQVQRNDRKLRERYKK